MIHIREIDHIVLRVVDLQRMLAFYCGVLGCTIERREDSIGLVQLRAGSSLIDLVRSVGRWARGGAAPGTEGRNLDHFCVRVEPFDEMAIRRHLRGAWHRGRRARDTERRGRRGPSIYVCDPEGTVVELKGPASH
jgi:catechol 2,3-dioxygenase-like lactoylglutathione lyase family enzyme